MLVKGMQMESRKKICTACGRTKALDEFYVDRAKRDGHCGSCIECKRKAVKAYANTASGRTILENYRRSDSFKRIQREYAASSKGKDAKRRWRSKPENRRKELAFSRSYESRIDVMERREQYRRGDSRRKSQAQYSKSSRNLLRVKAYRKLHLEQALAREAVNRALRDRKMVKGPCSFNSPACLGCVDGHHYLGYEENHWYEVMWLCRYHHRLLHHGFTR